MLTKAELNTLPYNSVSITDSIFFPQNQVLEINNRFYIVLNAQFPTGGFKQAIRMYNKQNHLFLYDLESGTCVRLITVDMIKSHVQEFDGFAPGKKFALQNGQVWEQTDGLHSNCSPGGRVWIKDQCVMHVGNWDFFVQVKQIK